MKIMKMKGTQNAVLTREVSTESDSCSGKALLKMLSLNQVWF